MRRLPNRYRGAAIERVATPVRQGTVIYVNPASLAIVEEAGSEDVYPFTFDKIAGYRGETARELPVARGSHVRFVIENDVVSTVEVVSLGPAVEGSFAGGNLR